MMILPSKPVGRRMSLLRLDPAKRLCAALLILAALAAAPCGAQTAPATATTASAAAAPADIKFNLNLNTGTGGAQLSDLMKIVLVLSVLTLVPSLLLTMTAFTRVVIVLSFVRRALAVQGLPPNPILIGISLFLTLFVMAPVFGKINEVAIQPDVRGEITDMQAFEKALGPLREFMFKQTRKKDLALFLHVAKMEKPRTRDDVPTHVLLPAFALSEIKTSFQMGFIIYLPMLVVDMVVATLLTSMGMFMLPPATVSVPLKILLFVLVDGWHLVIGSLAQSFS
jgi:flagellar biosynthetic protein FliP